MSKFKEKDAAFLNKIVNSISARQIINANQNTAVADLSPRYDDDITVTVAITKSEIAAETGRSKVRDVVIQYYAKQLTQQGLDVIQTAPNTLSVTRHPFRNEDNNFKSLASLCKKNQQDLNEDPSLGKYEPD